MLRTGIFITTLFALAVFFMACGGAAENTNNAVVNASNTVSNGNRPASDPLTPATPTPEQTSNNAPTLSPVYKAYCAAWVKKDEAALRKIYTSDTIKDFEKNMKADGIKTLTEYLADDKASNELCEARNEKITGNTATAEVKTLGYPSGITIVFEKENGEWKMTNKRPDGALK